MKKTLTRTCACGSQYIMTVLQSDYDNWRKGMLIQHAFPYLTSGEREMLITGICDSCFDELADEYGDA